MREVKARYVHGLTRTPKRSDGLSAIAFMQCAPVRYRAGKGADSEGTPLSRVMVSRFAKTFLDDVNQENFTQLVDGLCADGGAQRSDRAGCRTRARRGRDGARLDAPRGACDDVGESNRRAGVRDDAPGGIGSAEDQAGEAAHVRAVRDRKAVCHRGDGELRGRRVRR